MEHNEFYPKEKLLEMQGKKYIAFRQGRATRYRKQIISELEGLVNFITCPEYIKDALALIKELTEENERLREHIKEGIDLAKQIPKMLNEVSRGTVRKMHSMLCEGRVSNDNVVIVANQIAKEMIGEIK